MYYFLYKSTHNITLYSLGVSTDVLFQSHIISTIISHVYYFLVSFWVTEQKWSICCQFTLLLAKTKKFCLMVTGHCTVAKVCILATPEPSCLCCELCKNLINSVIIPEYDISPKMTMYLNVRLEASKTLIKPNRSRVRCELCKKAINCTYHHSRVWHLPENDGVLKCYAWSS